MSPFKRGLTRRDFMKMSGCAALGAAGGLSLACSEKRAPVTSERIVLVRDRGAVDPDGRVDGKIIQRMMDDAVMALLELDDPLACWQQLVRADDVVGVKSNQWEMLPTPWEVEQAILKRLMDAGVADTDISIEDRSVLDDPVFSRSTALINVRPLRTHAWSGVGSLIKNYINFVPEPSEYHGNSCADLGAIWHLPHVKGKTRLNILVLLTPLFYGIGPHHFDQTYVWRYGGLLLGTDPVAVDTVGIRIFQAKRQEFFGEERPIRPTAHHVALADMKYHLGTSNIENIDLIKLGWEEGVLI